MSNDILNVEKPMSRFQALTDALLDEELDALRRQLGLRKSQKAELLRQITDLASWVIQQSADGCAIHAKRGNRVEPLQRPALDRLREEHARARRGPVQIELSDAEVERLAEILDRRFSPTPALRRSLERLARPKRHPPKLDWDKSQA